MATYPGLSAEMQAEVENVLAGRADPRSSKYVHRRQIFHHRVQPVNAGTTSMRFFNADPANAHIGNMRATGLPNETFAIVHGMRIRIETGLTTAGAGATDGAQATDFNNTAATGPIATFEALRRMIETGLVNLTFGDQKVVEDVHGVYHFPAGGGAFVQAALASHDSTASTKSMAALVNVTNGDPGNINAMFKFPVPRILLPQKRVLGSIEYPAVIDFPGSTDGPIFKMELEAVYVTPFNN